MTRSHLAVVVFAVTALAAQDDLPRQRLFGIALRADRSPWVGARVHACASGPWRIPAGEIDHVNAISDERGRFHVEVLGGRAYAVWAEEAVGDGQVIVSGDIIEAWAGERVELSARAGTFTAPLFVLRELPRDLALPLRAAVRDQGTGFVEEFRIDALDGGGWSHPLTPTPPGSRVVTVRDAQGTPVLAVTGAGAVSPSFRPALARWVRVRVEDHQTKAGIADAEILAIVGSRPIVVGKTDAAGFGVFDRAPFEALEVDATQPTSGASFVTSARGYGFGKMDLAELAGRSTREAALTATEPDLVVRPRKSEAPPLRVRLRVGETALEDARVHMSSLVSHHTDQGSVLGSTIGITFAADADGVVELPGGSSPMLAMSAAKLGPATVTLVIDAPMLRRLPASWRERLPASVPVVLPATSGAGESERFDLDLLRAFRPVDVELVAADGATPVAGVDVHFGPLSAPGIAPLRSDRAGRVRALVPTAAQEPFAIATIGESGWCAHQLDAGESPADAREVARIRMQLEAPLRVEVSVLPGRLPRLPEDLGVTWFQNFTGTRVAQGDARGAEPARGPIAVPLDARRQAQLLRALAMRRMPSGDRVTIFVPSLAARMTIQATGKLDGQQVRTSGIFNFDGSEGRVAFELTFDK
ncbi:MAG: hypothetical protein HZB39_13665 [Planctomycetes bacterium]|nr:hypothetical protein [Planctomycetota bacterium]